MLIGIPSLNDVAVRCPSYVFSTIRGLIKKHGDVMKNRGDESWVSQLGSSTPSGPDVQAIIVSFAA